MHIMTRVGTKVLDVLGEDGAFVRGLHSVGAPLRTQRRRRALAVQRADQVHLSFSRDPRDLVVRSGYGGNALLGKKCHALRIASVQARDEGWLAEHMLILKLTNPAGDVRYITGAFPSACGKTNLAMLIPTVPGWTVETIGDDIAWMKFAPTGACTPSTRKPGSSASRPGRA